MEASFKSRVDQIFGSLRSSSSSSIASWSVSEQEVPRKEWNNRERNDARDDVNCASHYEDLASLDRRGARENTGAVACKRRDSLWKDGLDDLEEEADGMDVDDGENGLREITADDDGSRGDSEEEARQMRLMVGLDATLDFEDEEDEFDKVAVGREGAGERIYMRELKSSNTKINSFNALPTSFSEGRGAPRDPRANHWAAKARLEEDAREAAASSTAPILQSTKGVQIKVSESGKRIGSIISPCVQGEESLIGIRKPIIGEKRQSREMETQSSDLRLSPSLHGPAETTGEGKPVKRVRFTLDNPPEIVEPGGTSALVVEKNFTSVKRKQKLVCPSTVPDHVRNPSKYIHYTLDWSDEDDEKQNLAAFKSCAQLLHQTSTASEQKDGNQEVPEKIQFVPRPRESAGTNPSNNCTSADRSVLCDADYEEALARPVGIAAGHHLEECVLNTRTLSSMPISSDTIEVASDQKSGRVVRKYRARAVAQEEEKEMET